MKKWSFLLLSAVLCSACSVHEPSVLETERIISVLASDEMRGRQAFSPEAMDAARYIATEFETAGLRTATGDEDYIQDFPMYSVATQSVAVTINGKEVPSSMVAASISTDSLLWTGTDSPDVVFTFVGPNDDLMAAWRTARSTTASVLIVHPDQKTVFDRIAGFMNRPSRTMDRTTGSNMVVILSDDTAVTSYAISGTSTTSQTSLANVVGVLEGNRTDEIVVFSGHYDHIGIQNGADADSIANGANDNASGTTAVIQLANYFASLGKPERTIYFVAFTAEESGGYGSRYFSQSVNPDQIVAMFNIEMIGKPAVEGPNTAWITGFERTDFGTILQEAVEGTEFEFYPDPYPDQNLFYRSDNATLARLGVPAHTISTTPIDVDPDYHQVSDEVATLDLDHLTNTIKAIAAGAKTIISGEKTPIRIDPSTVN